MRPATSGNAIVCTSRNGGTPPADALIATMSSAATVGIFFMERGVSARAIHEPGERGESRRVKLNRR